MRKPVEILQRIEELKRTNREEDSVQLKLLNYVISSNESANQLNKNLTDMYEVTIDKKELSKTIDDLPFSFKEILFASDILAWILIIPKKVHKKNTRGLEKKGLNLKGDV